MCKTLANEPRQLSPTKFHNSVHNAAAGYWTISTGCMQAANSVAGYEQSVPLTLLEAVTQVCSERKPALLTFYDAPVSPILKSLLKNEQAFAFSMVLAPLIKEAYQVGQLLLEIELLEHPVAWPNFDIDGLQECYTNNPTAKILPLLSTMVEVKALQTSGSIEMPLSKQTSIRLTVSTGHK